MYSEALLEAVKTTVSLVFLAILGYYDLRSRLLPDILVYLYVGISIPAFALTTFYVYMYHLFPALVLLIYFLFSAVLTTGLIYALFKMGFIGDGDVYVMLAIGFLHTYPNIYGVTLQKHGVLPPGLVILLYACIVQVLLSLFQALTVLFKYHNIVQNLRGIYKLVIPFLAKPVKIRDYVGSGRYKYVFPVQCPDIREGEVKWMFKLMSKINEEDCILKYKDYLVKNLGEVYIWVSPKIPFVLYMFIGLVVFMLLGDSIVRAMFQVLFHG